MQSQKNHSATPAHKPSHAAPPAHPKKIAPPNPAPQMGILGGVALLVGLLTAGGAAYIFWETSRRNIEIAELQKAVAAREDSINAIGSQTEIAAFLRSEQQMERAQTYRQKWSKIAAEILDLQSSSIQWDSFSVADAKVSISARAHSVGNVLQLIEKLEADSRFLNPFVSSISAPAESQKLSLSFSLTFELAPSFFNPPLQK